MTFTNVRVRKYVIRAREIVQQAKYILYMWKTQV